MTHETHLNALGPTRIGVRDSNWEELGYLTTDGISAAPEDDTDTPFNFAREHTATYSLKIPRTYGLLLMYFLLPHEPAYPALKPTPQRVAIAVQNYLNNH